MVFFFLFIIFFWFFGFCFCFFGGGHIYLKRLIMYDLISRIPCTLLGQRIIVTKNNRALLINERFCFNTNSEYDIQLHFLITHQLMSRLTWHWRERWLGIRWGGIQIEEEHRQIQNRCSNNSKKT